MDKEILVALERRLGKVHARQRLGIEKEIEPRIFGKGLNFFGAADAMPGISGSS